MVRKWYKFESEEKASILYLIVRRLCEWSVFHTKRDKVDGISPIFCGKVPMFIWNEKLSEGLVKLGPDAKSDRTHTFKHPGNI